MGRLRSLALVALLLGGTFVLVGAGIDRDDSGRNMLGVPKDSTSTLEIGDLTGQFPTDTAAVPLYLHTDSLVTYIEARIYWENSDLELVSVVPGPGIPGTATLNTSMPNDSTVIVEISNPGDPFGIPSGDAIAHLNFEIQCFGYGQSTWIRFVDDDNYNVYVCNGLLYSPLRDDGRLWMAYETHLYVYGTYTHAYAGEQDISLVFRLYQQIPGKALCANHIYDSDYVHFDSVTVGEDLMPGDTVYATVVGDTIKVTLPETNAFLPPGDRRIFYLHFGAETDDDDYVTPVYTIYSERLDKCGEVQYPQHMGANIIVENHTATADIGEVYYYTTATTYDVWVKMGSNYPVNDYELWVEFPKDTIAFDKIVAYDFFKPPLGALSGDSTKVLISADIDTEYPPSSPTIVFKIRFNRLIYLPAWTVLPITFYETSQNHISYDMDDPFGYHQADLTLLDGSINIRPVPPPPPACPALYIWSGDGFERENTILAECDGKVVQNDVTDYYLVSKRMQADSDLLRFQIREDGEEISTFSDFRLLVVDHPDDKPIHVTREGKIITIGQPHSIIWAKDSKGEDITELIATKDGVQYIASDGGWFDVSFGKLSAEEIEGFTALTATKPKDEEENSASGSTTRAPLGASQPEDTKLNVSLKMADGSWQLISSEDARLEPATQATLIDPALVSPDRELILRYSWDGYYGIDVLDFAKAEPFEGKLKEMKLSSASHSVAGVILDRLGSALGEPVTLVPGEVINLEFTVSSIPPYAKGTKRDYVFVTTGQYHKEGEETPRAEFALDANFPNPFNPSTTIRYNLPRPTYVELKIYDVRGALVRTLVAGHQGAGEKKVTWDGRLDSGTMASSGVYFYQLKTAEFNRTRKMVLLK
jgi:hypothetical protein